jgi:hypothetical protein
MRIQSDLIFSFEEPPTESLAGRSVSGSIRADGTHIEVVTDGIPEVSVRTLVRLLRKAAAGLAVRGLTLSVHGPEGVVLSIGAVKPRVLDRLLTRSRHIRLQNLRTFARVVRQRPGVTTRLHLSELLPPPTAWPLAPTFRRLPRRVTTTHDPLGGGHPRLFFDSARGLPTRVFYLKRGTTTIGSDDDCDLVLGGVDSVHAEIRRNEEDEYVLSDRATTSPSRLNGRPVVGELILRTGSRIELGSWVLSYFRTEESDHGRPYEGRIGGELGYQRPQRKPSYQPPDS